MYNLFISHSWAYSDQYDRLVSLLNAAPNFDYRNYSVPKDDPIHNAPYQYQLKEAMPQMFIDVADNQSERLQVAAYARVSTEKEEQEDSFERQVEGSSIVLKK